MLTDLAIASADLLAGLRRIAYTSAEAICEIVDNAIDAMASKIYILIKRTINGPEYLILDDGKGMDEAGIQNALTLGASEINYAPNSLSKFGLGLKSAAFSQGDELDLISSPGNGAPFLKYRVRCRASRTPTLPRGSTCRPKTRR